MADEITLLELVRRAVETLGGKATYKQIMEVIHRERPSSPDHSIRAHIFLLTVNHPSRIHFPQNKKPRKANNPRWDVLFSIGRGEVELYDQERHGLWEIQQEGDRTVVVDPDGQPVRTSGRSSSEGLKAWVIRAGKDNRQAERFEQLGKVAIGFQPTGDLTGMSANAIASHVAEVFQGQSTHEIGARSGTLQTFALKIKKGDLVLTPTEKHSEVLVGWVTGDYEFAPEPLVASFRHNRSIEWIGRVERDTLPSETQKGLDAPRTVYTIGGAEGLYAMFGKDPSSATPSQAWIFQANPKIYDIRGAAHSLDVLLFSVLQSKNEVHRGHRVYLWEAGAEGGIVGVGEVVTEPEVRPHIPDEFVREAGARYTEDHPRVDIRMIGFAEPVLSRTEIKADPRLMELGILKFANATNFKVSSEEDEVLWGLLSSRLVRTGDPLLPKWTNAWWVNQGATFKQENEGGYVWAPNTSKGGGQPYKHWSALTGMKVGDLIFSYANKTVRAVSRVTNTAAVTDRPSDLPLTEWEGQGWKVPTRYFLLNEPIELNEIPLEWRTSESGPFDVNGGVKQQYANHLSEHFVKLMIDRFGDRIRNASGPQDNPLGPGGEVDTALIDLLKRRMNVVFYGPPGTGKTYFALQLANQWEDDNGPGSVRKVTFHPSYGYEDFVQGFRPKEDDPGQFALQPGILLRICEEAAKEPDRDFLLLIDEINRGDVARVFGELITYIEVDKRGIQFDLAQDPTARYEIPPNVFFLGTMNTADKSVSLLDVALRRRFAFVEFRADPAAYGRIPQWADSVSGIKLGDLLERLNFRLLAEGIEIDRAIGHALLAISIGASDSVAALRERIQYDIAPLVAEYSYLDRSRIGRILSGLVDDQGRYREELSRDEFLGCIRAIATQAPTEPETQVPSAPAGLGIEVEAEATETELESG